MWAVWWPCGLHMGCLWEIWVVCGCVGRVMAIYGLHMGDMGWIWERWAAYGRDMRCIWEIWVTYGCAGRVMAVYGLHELHQLVATQLLFHPFGQSKLEKIGLENEVILICYRNTLLDY